MKKYLLTIDCELYAAFRELAKQEGRTMRWLLEEFIRQFVSRTKPIQGVSKPKKSVS